MSVISVRPDKKMAEELETYAKQMERSKAYLLKEAWDEYVAYREWQMNEIKAGMAEARVGKFATEADFKALEKRLKSFS